MTKILYLSLILSFVAINTAQSELIHVTSRDDGFSKHYYDKYSLKYRDRNDNIRFIYVIKASKSMSKYDGLSQWDSYLEVNCRDMVAALLEVKRLSFSNNVETLRVPEPELDWTPIGPEMPLYAVTKAACTAAHKRKK